MKRKRRRRELSKDSNCALPYLLARCHVFSLRVRIDQSRRRVSASRERPEIIPAVAAEQATIGIWRLLRWFTLSAAQDGTGSHAGASSVAAFGPG